MTNQELFQKLRPIVELVTGLTGKVILADQNVKAPTGEYATIRPRQTLTERGQANIYDKDKAGNLIEVDVRAQVIAACSINFFRGNAQQYAEMLKQCNKRPDVSMTLFKAGLGWMGTEAANNLTALQADNWEERAQITIKIAYEVRNIADVNNILSASVIVENEEGVTIQEIQVPD